MKEIAGNFWDVEQSYKGLCCTTNCVVKNDGTLVMGAGIAKQFSDKFPHLPLTWGKQVKNLGKPHVLFSKIHTQWLIGIPTKIHWRDNSSLELISQSLQQLVTVSNALGLDSVLLTRPGCGLGGLNWDTMVRQMASHILDNRFTVIHNNENNYSRKSNYRRLQTST